MFKPVMAAMSAAFLAASANAADHVLDTTPDDTPDGTVVFTLTVPYELTDVSPDARAVFMTCRMSVDYPGPGGIENFEPRQYMQTRNFEESTIGADGFRDVSGEFVYIFDIPAEKASDMLRPEHEGRYQCDTSLRDNVEGRAGRSIHFAETTYPYWAAGVSGGRVAGKLLAPPEEQSGPQNLKIDPDLVKRPRIPGTSPRLTQPPKKEGDQ